MYMVNAEYDVAKINKEKKLLSEKGIIGKAFLRKLRPKVKIYSRIRDASEIISWTG